MRNAVLQMNRTLLQDQQQEKNTLAYNYLFKKSKKHIYLLPNYNKIIKKKYLLIFLLRNGNVIEE